MIEHTHITDAQIDEIFNAMPGGPAGFMKSWGYRQFAQQLLALRAMPTWEPEFLAIAPGQEELAVKFCAEIAGPKGKPGRPPDPVRLLEMAEALYQVERAAADGLLPRRTFTDDEVDQIVQAKFGWADRNMAALVRLTEALLSGRIQTIPGGGGAMMALEDAGIELEKTNETH